MPSKNLAPDPYLDCYGDEVYQEWMKYNNAFARFTNELYNLLQIILEMEERAIAMRKLAIHKHSQHYHPEEHIVDKLEGVTSPRYHYRSDPPHTVFPKEKDCWEDLDQDGTICSRDFLIVDGPPLHREMRYDSEVDIPSDISWHLFDEVLAEEEDACHPENPESVDSGLLETNVTKDRDTTTPTIVRNLINEIVHGIDQDDNSLVYNLDFYISDDDPDKPALLTNIENTSSLIRDRNAEEMTMSSYLSTIGEGEYSSDITEELTIPGVLESTIIENLVNEAVYYTDQDGDGLVYARDFIIVGDDTPVELMSKYPALVPDIFLTWNTYLQYALDEFEGNMTGLDYIKLLLQEYEQQIDLDGNGLIYGIDFILDPDHPNLPDDTFTFLPELTSPENLIQSWNWYIQSLSTNPTDPGEYMVDELCVKMAAECKTGEDVDENGIIYCHDCILSDYDTSKCSSLSYLEETLNLERDTEVYKDIIQKYLPKATKAEFTVEEWNEYWGLEDGDDGYKSELACTQCLNIEKQTGTTAVVNGEEVTTDFKFQKFVVVMSWADILKESGETDWE